MHIVKDFVCVWVFSLNDMLSVLRITAITLISKCDYYAELPQCSHICLKFALNLLNLVLHTRGNALGLHMFLCYHTLRFNEVERGYTGFILSVCPSVDRIVSALYLQQYSWDPFHICTSYQATSDVSRVLFVSKWKKKWNFGIFFKSTTLTLSSFDLGSNMTQENG